MNDTQRTIERITSANPVPSLDAFPTSAMSSADLLARIDERNTAMTDTLTPIRNLDPEKPPRRTRGPLIAIAVAAIVVLVLGFSSLFLRSEDATPPSDTSPTLESPLGADADPLDIVAAVQVAWERGDLIAVDDLVQPGTRLVPVQELPAFAAEIWYRVASGAVVDRDCAIGTASGLDPAWLTGGTVVTCNETITSGIDGTVIGGGPVAAEIVDGWLVSIFILPEYVGALSERGDTMQFIGQYRNWVQERQPDDLDTMFRAATMIVATPEAQAKHLDYMPFFVADTGPRVDGALAADTPLLEVVAAFTERYEAGDIAGYEAIFHPLSGYDSGQDAESSWFTAVTGVTAERDCVLVEPTQVRCSETISSGLLPGTVVGEFTTVWNGAAGYIWSIEFVGDAPQRSADPALAPGVKEYRDWVRTNEPDAFDALFAGGLKMRLGTDELREAHRQMIAAYLSATS